MFFLFSAKIENLCENRIEKQIPLGAIHSYSNYPRYDSIFPLFN